MRTLKKNNSKLSIIILGIFIIFGFLLYMPILQGYFVAEDLRHINFSWDEVGSEFSNEGQSIGFRPGTSLYFVVCNKLFGRNPVGHHSFAIFFHTIIGWLIYKTSFELHKNTAVALLAAFLFLCSPVNTESVAWLAAAGQLVTGVLCMLAIWFWSKEVHFRKGIIGLVAILYFLALFIKEVAIPLPGLLLLVHWVDRKKTFDFRTAKDAMRTLYPYAPLLVAFGLYFFFYIHSGTLSSSQGYGGMSDSIFLLIVKAFVNFSLYARDLFQPLSHALQPVLGLSAGNFFWIVIFILFFHKGSSIRWAFLWVLIALLPNIFVYAERLMYFALIGFYMGMSYLIVNITKSLSKNRNPKIYWSFFIGLFSIMMAWNIVLVRIEIMNWVAAGEVTRNIPQQAKNLLPEVPSNSLLYFLKLPDNIKGAYAFRWGIDHEIKYVYGNEKLNVYNVSIDEPKWGQISSQSIPCEDDKKQFFFIYDQENSKLNLVDRSDFGVTCP